MGARRIRVARGRPSIPTFGNRCIRNSLPFFLDVGVFSAAGNNNRVGLRHTPRAITLSKEKSDASEKTKALLSGGLALGVSSRTASGIFGCLKVAMGRKSKSPDPDRGVPL